MMQWLLIISILLLAIMPIFWILPSTKQRRQSQQRQHAMQLGFRVTLVRLPACAPEPWELVDHAGRPRTPTINVARYALPLAPDAIKQSLNCHWHVARTWSATNQAGPALPEPFKWRKLPSEPENFTEDDAKQIARCISQLPDAVVALERKHQELAIFWLEFGDNSSVDQIYESLQPLLTRAR